MELFFIGTGEQRHLRLFEERLNTIPMMLPFTTKEGKKMEQPLYGMLQEIKLYRYIFPRAYKNDILKTLNFPNTLNSHYDRFNPQTLAMRKILGLKKITKPKGGEAFFINADCVGMKAIGIKEDKDVTFPNGNTNEGI
ncbi:hypothetical protein LCGC14_1993170 [marine sediment metagenome]|uniref:Uncharacterized protein n=1 Tax=marine sediment metagenome TaxID=412755 RepID=A0A0F9HIT9_9ZZZZ